MFWLCSGLSVQKSVLNDLDLGFFLLYYDPFNVVLVLPEGLKIEGLCLLGVWGAIFSGVVMYRLECVSFEEGFEYKDQNDQNESNEDKEHEFD